MVNPYRTPALSDESRPTQPGNESERGAWVAGLVVRSALYLHLLALLYTAWFGQNAARAGAFRWLSELLMYPAALACVACPLTSMAAIRFTRWPRRSRWMVGGAACLLAWAQFRLLWPMIQ